MGLGRRVFRPLSEAGGSPLRCSPHLLRHRSPSPRAGASPGLPAAVNGVFGGKPRDRGQSAHPSAGAVMLVRCTVRADGCPLALQAPRPVCVGLARQVTCRVTNAGRNSRDADVLRRRGPSVDRAGLAASP